MITSLTCDSWEEAISARLDGELGPAEGEPLDEHLATCPRCRAFEDRASALHRTIRVRPAEPLPDMSMDILATHGGRRHRGLILAGAAAVVGFLALVAGLVATSGPAPEPLLAHIGGVATSAAEGSTSAVYLELVNDGGGDHLVGARADAAEVTELHVTETRDGLVVMLEDDGRPVAGHGTTIFGPGGSHVMLEAVTDDLEPGDTIQLTLDFARSGNRTISVPVVSHTDIPDAWWPGAA